MQVYIALDEVIKRWAVWDPRGGITKEKYQSAFAGVQEIETELTMSHYFEVKPLIAILGLLLELPGTYDLLLLSTIQPWRYHCLQIQTFCRDQLQKLVVWQSIKYHRLCLAEIQMHLKR